MSNKNEYDAILAALELKKDAIIQAIAVIKDMRRDGNPIPAHGPLPLYPDQGAPKTPTLVNTRLYHGLGVVEATRQFLRNAGTPQKISQIVKGLRQGGLNSTSKKFYNNVFSILNRKASKPGSDIVKYENGWGLKEWQQGRASKEPQDVTFDPYRG